MQNIYLVRHGESMGNVDKNVHKELPDHAIPLSETGHSQAIAAGKSLRQLLAGKEDEKVRIWTSPYQRTRQTASYIETELNEHFQFLDKKEDIKLCEQQFGLFDGVPDEDLPIRFPDEHAHYDLAARHEGRFWARMPLGESRFDVACRVHQSFGTFHRDAERHNVRNIIVVCHGVTLRAFVMMWRHYPVEWFENEKNPGNCDIYHIGEDEELDRGYVHRSLKK